MCPEEGLPIPRICPSGFVCDTSGTVEADQPCPEGHFCLEGTATTATFCGISDSINQVSLSKTLAEPTARVKLGKSPNGIDNIFGGRNSVCWNNSTDDFGLQSSQIPSRIWSEMHLLPLDQNSFNAPLRGRFCSDDSCYSLNALVDAFLFDYSSPTFSLRRPIPCPKGMYCQAGTSINLTNMNVLTTPQPCFESMHCPEGSSNPMGAGECDEGFYCPFGEKLSCPIGTFCPQKGQWEPFACEPGSFNGMVGQTRCTPCPMGFICPGFGRIDPAICPHGYVCSAQGLVTPNLRCPAGFYCKNGTITSDPFRNDTTLRPYPCSPGSFCLSGTGYSSIIDGNVLYAQPCQEGFFCESASTSSKGSGLCPVGFTCPRGTATPIPTQPGAFAEFPGTIKAATCLPGYYAPTIESTECYPCPPGTSCEAEGTIVADICPPGTYRSTKEENDLLCEACPQGTWSKAIGLKELGECIRCPPGVICPVDGMTNPCSKSDLPTPFDPVVNVNGIPVPEYWFPLSQRPPYFSSFECLKLNAKFQANDPSIVNQEFFYGELIPPYIDILGRGAHFRSSELSSLKYGNDAKCYRNVKPSGSAIYQKIVNYYGPEFKIQLVIERGDTKVNMNEVADPILLSSVNHITHPSAREFEPSFNCTTRINLFNETLVIDEHKIVYTNPMYDFNGGYDIEKCPFFDESLNCFVDPTY